MTHEEAVELLGILRSKDASDHEREVAYQRLKILLDLLLPEE